MEQVFISTTQKGETMSFIPSANHQNQTPEKVSNNGFFPDIDMAQFREVMRVEQPISNLRTKQAILDAIISVNNELKAWPAFQNYNALNYSSLKEVPCEQYGEVSQYEHHYQSAVFNKAKALLLENYRDFDSTKSGHERADQMEERVDDYLRRSRESIRALLGTAKITIELI
ncbi:head completion/stabilization protein [Alteromonas sp. a30]|uniref:head completion/stabilization protein n=1 Tax=Alteromonas sp. a30 TaxID=2730917 RepID=UPI002281E0B2|nr:head completion/stabilization protein [Alteromonas sp. a30]MCY7297459.1 head completion/stabilization protein [Alteromonas sp. a30]